MSGRPSDGFTFDELRDEFDWMFEFQSRMAERIRGDADVHSEVDYVGKLEAENDRLRELLADMFREFVRCDMALRKHGGTFLAYTRYIDRMRELGVEP